MRTQVTGIIVVLLASLALQGESCLLEQRTVSAVLGTSIPAEFVTVGYVEGSSERDSSITVDAADDIIEAIEDADIDVDDIKSIALAGGCYEVIESTGHDARRAGTVEVDDQLFLSFDVPTNAAGTAGSSGDGTLTLTPAGVTYVNGKLNTFLQGLKNDTSPALNLTFHAAWTSTPPPTSTSRDNFKWRVCVNLQVEYEVSVDVPDPL